MNCAQLSLLLVGFWFLGNANAATPSPPIIIGEVIEEGLAVVAGPVEDKSAPHTAAGRTSTHEEVRFVQKTRLIPAKLGTVFGFRYRLSGIPTGEPLKFEMRSIHPPMKGSDGRARTISTAQFLVATPDGIYVDDLIYLLSEPFEVLPGRWILQILYDGRQLVSREFILQ
ncbi:MAG: DUF3859 domain-containing protein [Betaproteobacteria bacterium]